VKPLLVLAGWVCPIHFGKILPEGNTTNSPCKKCQRDNRGRQTLGCIPEGLNSGEPSYGR